MRICIEIVLSLKPSCTHTVWRLEVIVPLGTRFCVAQRNTLFEERRVGSISNARENDDCNE